MANEEVLGPRKTMFVLVIVVGCFAVLWPRILSPLIVGHTREQLKPNQIDREAGCCEVIFEGEMAVLQLLNEVCNSAVQANGKLSPYAAAECRRAINESCGVDIAAFLKRTDNVGKSSKMLLATLRDTNSSCLKEHFGVSPTWSFSGHPALSWELLDKVKQERSPIRGAGPHPALRERGRAIPPGAPAPPSRGPVPMPPHVRPPPIPGMRPPLGSPGGPVQAPKSSMGFVLPIYTICIIVFFVYTLSKILFKRTGGGAYEPMDPDPQFRRRVFRQESKSLPDQLVVTAISGLVAEVQQQMEASYAQNQQRQEMQDDNTRPYTNGTVLHNSGPVHIVASEYKDVPKEKTPEPEEPLPKESSPEPKELSLEPKESSKESSPEEIEPKQSSPETEIALNHKGANGDIKKVTDDYEVRKDVSNESSDNFLREERAELEMEKEKQSTPELLEEALIEDSPERDVVEENASVKVVGMETCAHAADGGACAAPTRPAPPARKPEEVQSIFLETSIPQQTRVLVADFADRADEQTQSPAKHAPLVVSGKMTLSLIQDAPRDTPEREPESMDEYTTASALTQAADEEEEYSEEEVEEEIEVEEIEEEEEADDSKPEKK